ncbi:MAG: hypothetical protein WKF84_24130 [Pyrinomonadaceae bacterium]
MFATVEAQTANPVAASTQKTSTFYYSDVHCSGLTEYQPSYNIEIIGAERESQRRIFGQGDYVYISGGSQQGVTVGQEFAVVRPRGLFRGGHTKKKKLSRRLHSGSRKIARYQGQRPNFYR